MWAISHNDNLRANTFRSVNATITAIFVGDEVTSRSVPSPLQKTPNLKLAYCDCIDHSHTIQPVISSIKIAHFKSVEDTTLHLGRVTVLIGENGSGKSNLLEAITFAACASVNKLDDEVLFPRGVRVTEPSWMMSAFPTSESKFHQQNIFIQVEAAGGGPLDISIEPNPFDEKPIERWRISFTEFLDELKTYSSKRSQLNKSAFAPLAAEALVNELMANVNAHFQRRSLRSEKIGLSNFLIYAPENSILRSQPPEGGIQPLGTKGEGLFRLINSFTPDEMAELQEELRVFNWFDALVPQPNAGLGQPQLQIQDRWLAPKSSFDQRSANEGFLFLLFYFTLVISKATPKFFSIDNIDTALNPRLCSHLMMRLVELCKKHDKQMICTTHNPAVLDGLDLSDDSQRLCAVRRDESGHTVVRRVDPPKPRKSGDPTIRLSEAFIRGLLGGVPENF